MHRDLRFIWGFPRVCWCDRQGTRNEMTLCFTIKWFPLGPKQRSFHFTFPSPWFPLRGPKPGFVPFHRDSEFAAIASFRSARVVPARREAGGAGPVDGRLAVRAAAPGAGRPGRGWGWGGVRWGGWVNALCPSGVFALVGPPQKKRRFSCWFPSTGVPVFPVWNFRH